MYKAIFTKVIPESKKYPKRIKTHNGGVSVNYVYQEKFSEWENHALACQNFCKINNILDQHYAAYITDGMVFIRIHPMFMIDEFTIFEEEVI